MQKADCKDIAENLQFCYNTLYEVIACTRIVICI